MKNENPIFSIITVCYNAETVIEKTLKSVTSQRNDIFQYIVIDGGSNDSTINIINQYKKNISIFVSEKDNGIYDAMNKGLTFVKGKYVLFMNAGDVFENKNVLQDINKLAVGDYDVIYGDVKLDYEKAYKIVESKSEKFIEGMKLSHMPFCHQSVFIKNIFFDKRKFDLSYKIVADFEHLNYMINNFDIKFKKYNSVVSCIQPDGFSVINGYEQIKERERVYINYNDVSALSFIFFIEKVKFFLKKPFYGVYKKLYLPLKCN